MPPKVSNETLQRPTLTVVLSVCREVHTTAAEDTIVYLLLYPHLAFFLRAPPHYPPPLPSPPLPANPMPHSRIRIVHRALPASQVIIRPVPKAAFHMEVPLE